MSKTKAEILLAVMSMAWGSSYVMSKYGLNTMPAFNLVALRFTIAFVVMVILFFPKIKKTTKTVLWDSMILGMFVNLVIGLLMIGLKSTTASSAGFLGSTSVAFVPILLIFLKRKLPSMTTTIGVILVVIGIGLLTLQNSFTIGTGEFYCLAGALVNAFYILIIDNMTKKEDGLLLGIWQLGFAGLFGGIISFFTESFVLPHGTTEWMAMLGLSLICSAFGFVVQAVAQKYTTPERTGILCSFEPVSSAVYGYIFFGEVMNLNGYLGAVLVVLGVIISGLKPIHIKSIRISRNLQGFER